MPCSATEVVPERRTAAVVLGSVHMDLIASAERMPMPGDSVTGTSFVTAPGGKAGNQACQLARCGVPVLLVGKIGDDRTGSELRARLESTGIDTRYLSVDPSNPTGTSTVLAAAGEYASIIVPGAAATITAHEIDTAFDGAGDAAAFVTQFELPIPTIAHAVGSAAARGWYVVLNASPAPADAAAIPESLWRSVGTLVVNRAEAARLLGKGSGLHEPTPLAAALRDRLGVGTVVLTLGPAGAVLVSGSRISLQPAFPVTVVDSVGAGDAFLGTFVAEFVAGQPAQRAMRRAAVAAAIAVTGRGAFDSIPTAAQIDEMLSHRWPSPLDG